ALLLTIQGRVTADVRVAVLDDAVVLDADVRARDELVDALGRLVIADDVELGTPDEDVALLGVEGPGTAALVGGAGSLAPFDHALADLGGVRVRVQRASEIRGPGVVVHAPATAAVRVWDALVSGGARPCGMEALEGRRIEVGVPRIGLDMDATTLALE